MHSEQKVETASVTLGRVSAPYGIKGWVRISSFTDPGKNLFDYEPWQLADASGQMSAKDVRVLEHRAHGKSWVARLEGVADRTAAEALRGLDIVVPRAMLPETDKDSYYWADLEGLQVTDTQGRALGRIDHLLATGSADVMVIVDDQAGSGAKENRHLVPFVSGDTVVEVDLDAGRIVIDWQLEDLD